MGKEQKNTTNKANPYNIILSDTDNDLNSVKYVLWMTGLCDKQGNWRDGLQHFRVIHTGDWLNKRDPSPEVLEFFQALQASAPKTCEVVLLVGNHEVEVLQRISSGTQTRLTNDHLAFIQQQDVVHVSGRSLYIHGYPTVHLLSILAQIKDENMGLNVFNSRFRKALYEGQYALFKEQAGLEIIGDFRRVKQYYLQNQGKEEPNGVRVSNLLPQLNIDTVIHGHRPKGLVQRDYELKEEVPGIRIINNDIHAKLTGLGAIVVDANNFVRFMNSKAMHCLGGEKAFRKRVRLILGTKKKKSKSSKSKKQPVDTITKGEKDVFL